MILRAISSCRICLRCEYQLSRISHTAPALRGSPLVPGLQRHLSTSHESANGDEQPLSNDDDGHRPRIRSDPVVSTLKQEYRRSKTKRKKEKVVLSKPLAELDDRVTEKRRQLKSPSFEEVVGDPKLARRFQPEKSLLILEEAQKKSSDELPLDEAEPPTPTDANDLLEQIPVEDGIQWTEVVRNIDELRPKTQGAAITLQQMHKLEEKLMEGFTSNQLSRYIQEVGPRAEEEAEAEKAKEDADESVRVTPWVADVSGRFARRPHPGADDLLQGYVSNSYTKKQEVALSLIRRCWNVEAVEVVEALGQIYMQLPRLKLEILLKGKAPLLKQLGDLILNAEGERIEIFRSKSGVRITANKLKAELIVSRIRNLLHHLEQTRVDFSVFSPSKKGDRSLINSMILLPDLGEVGRLTGTHITRYEDKITIHHVNLNPNSKRSTRADIATRLFLAAVDAPGRTVSRLICHEDPANLVRGHLVDANLRMSWADRRRKWVRWTTPVTTTHDSKSTTATMTTDGTKGEEGDRGLLSQPDAAPADAASAPLVEHVTAAMSTTDASMAKWSREPFTETSAMLGLALQNFGPDETSEPVTIEEVLDTSARRTFVPSSYNVSQLLASEQYAASAAHTSESIFMRFEPSPFTPSGIDAMKNFPALELRFAVHPNSGRPQLRDVLAVTSTHNSDIMLPDRPLDVRLQQRTAYRLDWTEATNLTQLPQLQEFLDASKLVVGRSRLETPARLTLPIPHYMAAEGGATGTTDVEYVFLGLDYRKSVMLDLMGWAMSYTSVEAGPAGGQRGELKLWARRTDSSHAAGAIPTESFGAAVVQLVASLEGVQRPTGAAPGLLPLSKVVPHFATQIRLEHELPDYRPR